MTRFLLGALLALTALWQSAVADDISFPDGTTLTPEVIAPHGMTRARLLWLPSEYGVLPQEKQLARALAKQGVESVFVDLFEAYFLPTAPSSLSKIPAESLGMLLHRTCKAEVPCFIVSADRGALLAVRAWQAAQQAGALRNAALVLINPNLYVATPVPGQTARYWPEAARLNAPVVVFQAELSPWRWRLAELVQRLQQGGSDVLTWLLPGVRDRFYFRPDAMPVEQAAARGFPRQLARAMALIAPWMVQPRVLPQGGSPTFSKAQKSAAAPAAKKAALLPYSGPQYGELRLRDLDGREVALSDYRGKVVLVNFWASWCPPCVHEIPSMVALKQSLTGQPFEILAVNLAEDAQAVKTFLQRHPVNFPVLLDPSGRVIKAWRVFAYPSSYLIDRQGRIRYAAFGALDWAAPEVRRQIEALLAQ